MEHGWRLTLEAWNALEPRVNGLAWRRVRFRRLDRDTVPSAAGIYAICGSPPMSVREHLPRDLCDVLYVGMSIDLQSRFLQHLTNPKEEMVKLSECYGPAEQLSFWFATAERSSINGIESALIDCFGPPANKIRGITATVGSPRPA